MTGRGGAGRAGVLLEHQFRASIPGALDGVYHHKVATPAPPSHRLGEVWRVITSLANSEAVTLAAAAHQFEEMAARGGHVTFGDAAALLRARIANLQDTIPPWVEPALRRSSFTVKQPYDLIIVAPAAGCADVSLATMIRNAGALPLRLALTPSIFFALELKAVSSGTNLPFDRVKDHQVAGLLAAADAGQVAGLVIEFPEAGTEGELYFLPVQVWIAYAKGSCRRSIPLEALRIVGYRFEVDYARANSKRYWRVDDFLRNFGATIPQRKRAPRPAPGANHRNPSSPRQTAEQGPLFD